MSNTPLAHLSLNQCCDLVQEGLELLHDLGPGNFLRASLSSLLEAMVSASKAEGVATPTQLGGKSILCSLAEKDLELAMGWEREAGQSAWAPSPHHPFPLAHLLESGAFGSALKHKEAKIQTFMGRGFECAMPLTAQRASEIDQSGAGKYAGALKAQACVSDTVLTGVNWASRKWLVQAFRSGDGELVLASSMQPQEMMEVPGFPPQETITYLEGFYNKPRRGKWHEVWEEGGDKDQWLLDNKALAVSGWMEQHGLDTSVLKRKALAQRINHQACLRNINRQARWEGVLKALEANSEAQQSCPTTRLPLTLLAFRQGADLLSEALNNPPPGGGWKR